MSTQSTWHGKPTVCGATAVGMYVGSHMGEKVGEFIQQVSGQPVLGAGGFALTVASMAVNGFAVARALNREHQALNNKHDNVVKERDQLKRRLADRDGRDGPKSGGHTRGGR
ncbi:MAG: hypothetical protein GEV07_06075 [Streptosporangiales bacterium]|nr:hypothetical protein [Streptosporangiales bacterium]